MYRLFFLVYRLIDVYELLIVAECIFSWIPVNEGVLYDIKGALRQLTDPFVDIFRRLIPMASAGGMGIDFSPMIAIIALDVIKRVVIALL